MGKFILKVKIEKYQSRFSKYLSINSNKSLNRSEEWNKTIKYRMYIVTGYTFIGLSLPLIIKLIDLVQSIPLILLVWSKLIKQNCKQSNIHHISLQN